MPKYNIYKIKKDIEKDLQTKLESVGLSIIDQRKLGNYDIKFLFSKKPDDVEIWWSSVYGDFFADIQMPTNKIYFACMVISNERICYAISLGKTHFYLKNYCDVEFGLNLGERIIDSKNLKIKNSKFFKTQKSKSITSYQDNSEIDYDSGESLHYIKAKTVDKDKWGGTASFGSSVCLNLELLPSNITNLIDEIELELSKPKKIEIPKTNLIKDRSTIEKLDKKLCQKLSNFNNDGELQIDEFSVSGVDFIFSDRETYSLFLEGSFKEKTPKTDLTISNLIMFSKDRGLKLETDLNKIKVYVHNEYGRGYSGSVKEYIDYVDEENFCLINGKWHQFNEAYIDYLKKSVDSISLLNYDSNLDIDSGTNEDVFNTNRVQDGYKNFDKNFQMIEKFKVEKMDLYKDNTLFFVKFGTTQKLNYVIDQSLNTVKLLQSNSLKIEIDGDENTVEKICLWIGLKNLKKVEKLSDLRSIIFLMKLSDWKKTVQNAGFKPLIKINYVK